MRYFLIFGMIAFTTLKVYSQERAYTFEQLQRKQAQTNNLESWEYWLTVARDQGNVPDQMDMLLKLAEYYYTPIYNNAKAYDLAISLENLLDTHAESEAVSVVTTRLHLLLGKLNNDLQEYEIGLRYFDRALNNALAFGDSTDYFVAGNHKAETLSYLGRTREALDLFNNLLTESTPESGALTQAFLASHYLRNNQLDSTLYYAQQSLTFMAGPLEMSDRHRLLAQAHFYVTENYDSSLYHGKEALRYALEVMAPGPELKAHNILNKVYEVLGDAERANFHSGRYYALLEEQNVYADALKIGRIKADKERSEAALQKELADEKLQGRNRVILFIALAIVILTVSLFYIAKQLKQIRKQNLLIEKEKQRAEISEQYKEQFLANMSHEIRTPMHAISGMLNALLRKTPREEQKVFLDAMKISADNLLVLLNDVLDMSKVEAGHLEIEQDNIRPADIINQVLELFQPRAQEKNLILEAKISPDFPECVLGDAARLSQVLINLVGNALKFTEKGYVKLTADLTGNKLQFGVEDTGIGIPQSEIDKVLGAFSQGSNVERGKHGGTGLGLSICQQIIELQNGRLWLESTEGKGSTFYVALPHLPCEHGARESDVPLALEEARQKAGELAGLKVLIAEDVQFNIMVICDDLEWFIPEVELTVVNTGKSAYEIFKEKSFDLVLMDVQMPEMNGYEATRAIRGLNDDSANTPIIAMTASLLKQQIDLCYEAGMDGYIPKPYKPEVLIEKIHTLIKKRDGANNER